MLGRSGADGLFSRRAATLSWMGAVVLWMAAPLEGGLLYFTEFENFPVGDGTWVGTDGWSGIDSGGFEGGPAPQGIDDDVVSSANRTAYLGSEPPVDTFVSVRRSMNHDPVASGTDYIEFEAVLAIVDSREPNMRRDQFFVAFYNTNDEFLAAIQYSNVPGTFGMWYDNGAAQFDTGIPFLPDQQQILHVEIDLINNLWRADLDALPLFTNVPFNATQKTRTLGPVAAEWLLSSSSPAEYGSNWMLVTEWSVWAIPVGVKSLKVDSVQWSKQGEPMVVFTAEPGWDYQVEYSDDMENWLRDLPGSFFGGPGLSGPQSFTDTTQRVSSGRHYRIVRTVSP